jgi:hypothetical protein
MALRQVSPRTTALRNYRKLRQQLVKKSQLGPSTFGVWVKSAG